MKKLLTARQALEDPAILGSAIAGPTWLAWRALLIAALGEELNREERRAFQALTRRAQEPLEVVEELIAIVGRRGGKTLAGAVLLVFLACLVDYTSILNIGEHGVALFIAQNQKQATVAFNYAAGIIKNSPMLRKMVVNETADTIELNNNITIEVRPASFRGLRGVTAVGVLADEAAFYYSQGANADTEILNAVRPSLATTGGMLAIFSSPYAQKGEVWELHSQHYGPDGDPRILVAQGASRDLNPSLSQRVVDRALARDAVAASAEYLAKFRQDVTGFIDRGLLQDAVDAGVTERPPVPGIGYVVFCDAASGIASSGDGDRFAVSVGHIEGETVVIDLVRRWMPPFNASEITADVAAIARAYRCSDGVISDGYSSGFLRAELSRHGVGHRISEFNKSECYLAALPMLTSHKVRLLDLQFVVDEFASLERRPGSGGHDKVDARGHEDSANCVAGVIAMLSAATPFAGWGMLEHYRRQAEAATAPPPVADTIRVVWPLDAPSHLEIAGAAYLVKVESGEFVFYLSRDHARTLLKSPFSRPDILAANLEVATGLEPLPREPVMPQPMRPESIGAYALRIHAERGYETRKTLQLLGRWR